MGSLTTVLYFDYRINPCQIMLPSPMALIRRFSFYLHNVTFGTVEMHAEETALTSITTIDHLAKNQSVDGYFLKMN